MGQESKIINRLGFYSSILTTILTIVTFVIAVLTPPLAGPYCTGNCYTYPFTDIASRFPRDYYWMYPAMILVLAYFVLMTCIHYLADSGKKIFSHLGMSFALISAAVFVIDYFLQVSVVQPSLLNGEFDGISLLSQFNAHGVFIALEEVGFILMSLSFLFMAPVFSGNNKFEKAVRWVFSLSFIFTVIALAGYSFAFGINREYLFEVAAISINWFTLIISGILLSFVFRRTSRLETS